jgi:glycerol kinase
MLMNLETLNWEEKVLNDFGIPLCTLPKILNSSDDYGVVRKGHLKGIKIAGVIGDQQSACMGHLLQKGQVKNTYGTGCFILMNTGETIAHSKFGLLTTLLYKGNSDEFNTNKPSFALEGAIETAGSALKWLKDNLGIFSNFDILPSLYNSVEDSGGVVFVPAFSGLFSPHWDSSASGMIIGLSHHTSQGHIIRATFEAISLRTYEVIQSFEKESNLKVECLKVDGGLTASEEFLQTQSNVLSIEVEKQKEKEITIIGSAIVAGLERDVKMWESIDELRGLIEIENIYKPSWSQEYLTKLHKQWEKAIIKSKDWN